jgi:hypothetical protein
VQLVGELGLIGRVYIVRSAGNNKEGVQIVGDTGYFKSNNFSLNHLIRSMIMQKRYILLSTMISISILFACCASKTIDTYNPQSPDEDKVIKVLRLKLYGTVSPKLTDPKGIEESCQRSSFQLAARSRFTV